MPKNKNGITYRTYRTGSLRRKVSYIFNRKKSVYSYLDELFRGMENVNAAGFKFMYGQARRYTDVIEWCKDFDVKVIHLIRRNALKAIVSRHVAKNRGIYLSSKPLQPIGVKLNIRKLFAEIQEMQAMIAIYRDKLSACPYMEVHYEDLIVKYSDESRRILNFLDADSDAHLTSHLVKTSVDSLSELIENYQQVCKAFAGSPYEQFLD